MTSPICRNTFPSCVEGKRDLETLRRLGIEGEVVTVNRGKGLYEVARELDRYDDVVLLMDWDQRGEQLHRNLRGTWSPTGNATPSCGNACASCSATPSWKEHLESALGERPKPTAE
jgi:5S rRNA maturation endonuclease (ribonuclease M5)